MYTLDIFAHNIAIKRYRDKNTFFIQLFFSCVIKNIHFVTILNIITSLQYLKKKNISIKISFYQNVFLSLCAKMCRSPKANNFETMLHKREGMGRGGQKSSEKKP